MIITQTPFRISFVGGGTDFKDYYKMSPGKVISTTINKFIYVTLNERFDGKIHLRYSQIEEVDRVDELQHDIVREALKMFGIESGIEIVIISDIPSKGSGLGSSSALAVGLLNALHIYRHDVIFPALLAEEACQLEIDILGAPIGKQDQYSAAYGGVRKYTFNSDNCVEVSQFESIHSGLQLRYLQESSMLFYLGNARQANPILKEHTENIELKRSYLDEQVSLVNDFERYLETSEHTITPGELINLGWTAKKALSTKVSNSEIDSVIQKAKDAGAFGVKVCGAGGGGFLYVLCHESNQEQVRIALKQLHELPFKFHSKGSEVIYISY